LVVTAVLPAVIPVATTIITRLLMAVP
jgi:hypothetical protein